MDVGRCTCVIVKEACPEGLDGGTLYSLYTNVSCLEFELVKHISFGTILILSSV